MSAKEETRVNMNSGPVADVVALRRGGRISGFEIEVDDPRADDVSALLASHLAFARSETPPEDAHALDVASLVDSAVTFFSLRADGQLLAVGAIRELAADHGELKSMHTSAVARRPGVGAALFDHLLGVARKRSYRQVSLETGSHPMFAPARALYARAGFRETGPFAHYRESPNSIYMTLELASPAS